MAQTTKQAERIIGIDVSRHQGNIDWHQVKQTQVEFCFMKATEGATWKDNKFDFNWNQTKAKGILRGAYHFFRPNAPVDRQISNFITKVGKLEPGDLPPVLDVEVPQKWTRFSQAKRIAMIEEWMTGVEEELGIQPVIYMNPSFANEALGNDVKLKKYILWLAHYTRRTSPSVPGPWEDWVFWQYTDKGKLAGIDDNTVDLNRFKGSIEELKKLTVQPEKGSDC